MQIRVELPDTGITIHGVKVIEIFIPPLTDAQALSLQKYRQGSPFPSARRSDLLARCLPTGKIAAGLCLGAEVRIIILHGHAHEEALRWDIVDRTVGRAVRPMLL